MSPSSRKVGIPANAAQRHDSVFVS